MNYYVWKSTSTSNTTSWGNTNNSNILVENWTTCNFSSNLYVTGKFNQTTNFKIIYKQDTTNIPFNVYITLAC